MQQATLSYNWRQTMPRLRFGSCDSMLKIGTSMSKKVGYLGFSAGGGVAIAATVQATEAVEKPNFLCTNFGPALAEVNVPNPTPPLLIMSRAEHPNVAAGLLALFLEWKKAGGNAEIHLYGDGSGPYQLMPQTGNTTTEAWSQQFVLWLQAKGFAR